MSTGSGIIGNNMFAYCDNNPVNYVDYTGTDPISLFLGVGILLVVATMALCAMLPALTANAPATTFPDVNDSPYAKDSITAPHTYWDWKIDSKVEEKEEVITAPPKNQAYFTVSPYDFNPNGLTRMEYAGTKNGKIIKWIDPVTNMPVFEWDEDLSRGSHYHILKNGKHTGDHISPGTPVPEPWNSKYFGG